MSDVHSTGALRNCRDDGRCQYAIDHGAEGLGHCSPKCVMPRDQVGALRQQPEAVDHDRVGLVDELRWLASGQDDVHSVAITEAADEIEALRVCLDWLDQAARQPGGILLHAEMNTGRLGLGLGPNCGNRHLREAIRYVRGSELPQTASGSHQEARSNEQGEST